LGPLILDNLIGFFSILTTSTKSGSQRFWRRYSFSEKREVICMGVEGGGREGDMK
jgi:hypothetical protein